MKKITLAIALVVLLCLTACGKVETKPQPPDQTDAGASEELPAQTPEVPSEDNVIDGHTIDDVMEEIESDGIAEKLISLGLTEEEADEGSKILRQCGVPSIDLCEPTDPNATVDGLVCFREKLDDDRVLIFTMENRNIFYVALNGEDLYDEDLGGFLKRFDDVHIPETYLSEPVKINLRDKTESVLDKYFPNATRYYDAWGFGREDNKFMVQCQVSDGSILSGDWIYAYVWYEAQIEGEFTVVGVKINGQQYASRIASLVVCFLSSTRPRGFSGSFLIIFMRSPPPSVGLQRV